MKKKRFFASLLVIALLLATIMPMTAWASADGLPRPGEQLRDPPTGGRGSTFTDGYDIVRTIVYGSVARLLELDGVEAVIYGDTLEFVPGQSVLVYENGHRIYPIHEIFADGERLTFFIDRSQAVIAEVYVKVRSVVGTVDTWLYVAPFSPDGRTRSPASGGEYPAEWSVGSPYRLTRPTGTGSITDVFYWPAGAVEPTSIRLVRPVVLPTSPQSPILNPGNPDIPIPPLPPTDFYDVPTSHWARPYINAVRERGLIQGVGNNRFDPNGTLTRAQVAQILFNTYGERLPAGTATFADVGSGWYAAAVSWAGYHRLIDPIGGNFRPHDPAPRGVTVEAMFRMATRLSVTVPAIRDPVTFTDQSAIANLAAVQALQQAGVISGFPDGSFGPHRTIIRAEMAALLYRFTNLYGLG